MYIYRWKDTNPQTVTYNQWYEWKVCNNVDEIREYIKQGKAYQIAKLKFTEIEGFNALIEHPIQDIKLSINL